MSSGFHRAGSRLALALAVLISVLTMLGLGVATASTQGSIVTRDTTINALGSGTLCTTPESCSIVDIHLSPDKEGQTLIVCLAVTGEISEEGCADVAGTFGMDTDELAWAELTPTSVELFKTVCEGKTCDFVYTRTVTLAVGWTATGELIPVHETLGDPHGPCTVTDKIKGVVRDTATTITIDGASVDTTGNLQMLDSKTLRRTNCG
ncbi:MAG TPA: hypothetical protein VM450_02450 [Thermomicrobiales bacterium]|nr:hypothetical protein [Thermomicrobiales bacterium]